MSDEEIIGLYQRRDKSAIARSEEMYGGYCMSVAGNILGSREDSEECVSDTWFAAWNAIPPASPARLKLFFARITRNLAVDRLRRNGAQKRGGGEAALSLEELSECVPGSERVEENLDKKLLTECIGNFLKGLSVPVRQIFIRRYFFACSIEDIARECGCSRNSVTVSLCRTRGELKKFLEKEGFLL